MGRYCRVREIGGQRAMPREDLRYCSCGIVEGKKNISFSLREQIGNATKRHSVFCHGTDVCHQKPHVLLCTIAHQQHARNHVLLRGSCGKVAGTQVLVGVLFPKFRIRVLDKALDLMVFQWFSWSSNGSHGLSKHECCSSAQKAWSTQVSLLCIAGICHSMALYVSWNMAPCGAMGAPPPS